MTVLRGSRCGCRLGANGVRRCRLVLTLSFRLLVRCVLWSGDAGKQQDFMSTRSKVKYYLVRPAPSPPPFFLFAF